MLRPGAAALLACIACAGLACAEQREAAPGGRSQAPVVWVALGGESFTLELAAEPRARQQGLSGRASIPRSGGMLFVYPNSAPRGMVMRDCPVPIDVAFLDSAGTVVAVAEMQPEPPRRADESRGAYERRLPVYSSGVPAQFAIEVAGGRLAQLGIRPGARLALDAAALVAGAR